MFFILFGDHFLQSRFDLRVGHSFPGIILQSAVEEIVHIEHALRCLHIFPRDRPAHRGDMDPGHIGHLLHGERTQTADTLLHKIFLEIHDHLGHLADGPLALFQTGDESPAGTDLLHDIRARLFGFAGTHHLLIDLVDLQLGQQIVVHGHLIMIPVLFHKDLRRDVSVCS